MHMLMFFISFSKTCFQWKMCRKIMKIMQFVKDFWKMIFMQKIFKFSSICLWFPSRFEFPLICENPLRIFCCFWMIFGTNSLRNFEKLIFSKKSFKNISICLWFGSWLARPWGAIFPRFPGPARVEGSQPGGRAAGQGNLAEARDTWQRPGWFSGTLRDFSRFFGI